MLFEDAVRRCNSPANRFFQTHSPFTKAAHDRNKEDGKEIDNGISPSW
jgi:hypothetical protein